MGDLIERLRDEAGKNMETMLASQSSRDLVLCDFIHRMDDGLRRQQEEIESLQARIKELESQWIPVSERLPEEGEWVLGATTIFNGKRSAKELFMDSHNYGGDGPIWLADGDWDAPVTHWMPLPQQPEE